MEERTINVKKVTEEEEMSKIQARRPREHMARGQLWHVPDADPESARRHRGTGPVGPILPTWEEEGAGATSIFLRARAHTHAPCGLSFLPA